MSIGSCDFTPLDYTLWGYVKSQVHKKNQQSIPKLGDEIIRVLSAMELCQNDIENFQQKFGRLYSYIDV